MFDFEALSQAITGRPCCASATSCSTNSSMRGVADFTGSAGAVIAVRRSETNIGGAGNVARNIASLGARCIFVGLVGVDERAQN